MQNFYFFICILTNAIEALVNKILKIIISTQEHSIFTAQLIKQYITNFNVGKRIKTTLSRIFH